MRRKDSQSDGHRCLQEISDFVEVQSSNGYFTDLDDAEVVPQTDLPCECENLDVCNDTLLSDMESQLTDGIASKYHFLCLTTIGNCTQSFHNF